MREGRQTELSGQSTSAGFQGGNTRPARAMFPEKARA